MRRRLRLRIRRPVAVWRPALTADPLAVDYQHILAALAERRTKEDGVTTCQEITVVPGLELCPAGVAGVRSKTKRPADRGWAAEPTPGRITGRARAGLRLMSIGTREALCGRQAPTVRRDHRAFRRREIDVAAAVQEHAHEPLLRFGVDELYRTVPRQRAGGVAHTRSAERGFTYQDVPSMPGARRINNSVDAIAMLHAMNAGIVGILSTGAGVIVDGQAFEPVVNTDLEDRLLDLHARGLARVAIIELSATDEPLADQQRRHPHPVGLSLHQNSLPKQATTPDLAVDTSRIPAAEVAPFACHWLEKKYPQA